MQHLQQPTHSTSKSTCEKFSAEDSVPGFRVEPRALPTSAQVPECGSTWNNTGDHHRSVLGRVCSSVRVARKKGPSNSNTPQYDAADLSNGGDRNQRADRPAVSSQKKDQQEVSSTRIRSDYARRSFLSFSFRASFLVSYACELL